MIIPTPPPANGTMTVSILVTPCVSLLAIINRGNSDMVTVAQYLEDNLKFGECGLFQGSER